MKKKIMELVSRQNKMAELEKRTSKEWTEKGTMDEMVQMIKHREDIEKVKAVMKLTLAVITVIQYNAAKKYKAANKK